MEEQDYYWKEGEVSGGNVTPENFKTTIFTENRLSPKDKRDRVVN
jgi:hypothetical protein